MSRRRSWVVTWSQLVEILTLIIVLIVIPGTKQNPINRQAGISENVYITVQNDTYGVEQRVCSIDSMTYEDGESIPTSSPCEHCLCRPPGFACTIISCEYRPGCKSIKRSDQCCPEYQCECEKDGKIYQNGEKILDDNNPCEVCYCQGGDVICAVIDCYWRSDCQPRYIENRCCPLYDHCPAPSDIGPIRSTTTSRPISSSTGHHGISWFNMSSAIYATPSTTTTTTTTTTTLASVPLETTTSAKPPQLLPELSSSASASSESVAQNEISVSHEKGESGESSSLPEQEASASEVSVSIANEISSEALVQSNSNAPTNEVLAQANANAPVNEVLVQANDNANAPINEIPVQDNANAPINEVPVQDNAIAPVNEVPVHAQDNDNANASINEAPVQLEQETTTISITPAEIPVPVDLPAPIQISSSITVDPNVTPTKVEVSAQAPNQVLQVFEDEDNSTPAPVPVDTDAPVPVPVDSDSPALTTTEIPIQIPTTTTSIVPDVEVGGPELSPELGSALQSLVNQVNDNQSSILPLDGLVPDMGQTVHGPDPDANIVTTTSTPEVVSDDQVPTTTAPVEQLQTEVEATTIAPAAAVVVPEATTSTEPTAEVIAVDQNDPIQPLLLSEEAEVETTTVSPPVQEDIVTDDLGITTTQPLSIVDIIPSEIIQTESQSQSQTPTFQPSIVHSIDQEGNTQVISIQPSSSAPVQVVESTTIIQEVPTSSTGLVLKDDEADVVAEATTIGVESVDQAAESEVDLNTEPPTTTTRTVPVDPAAVPDQIIQVSEVPTTLTVAPEINLGDANDDVEREPTTTLAPETPDAEEIVVFDDVPVPTTSTTSAPNAVQESVKNSAPSIHLEPPTHEFGFNPSKGEEAETELLTTDPPSTQQPTTILIPPIHDPIVGVPSIQNQNSQKVSIPDEKIPVVFVDFETGLTESPIEFGTALKNNMAPAGTLDSMSPEEIGESGLLQVQNDGVVETTIGTVPVAENLSIGDEIQTTVSPKSAAAPEESNIQNDEPSSDSELLQDEEVPVETTTTKSGQEEPLPLADSPPQTPDVSDTNSDKDSPIPNDHFFHLRTSTTTNSPTTHASVQDVEDELTPIVEEEAQPTQNSPIIDPNDESDQISFDDQGTVQTTTVEPPPESKFRNEDLLLDGSNEEAITTTQQPAELSRHHIPGHEDQNIDTIETTTFQPSSQSEPETSGTTITNTLVNNKNSTTTRKPSKFILPDHLVKRVDPISDDLPLPPGGGGGGEGKSDTLTLGEDAENEVANTEETWFWRTYNKLRTLFPSGAETRSARRPRRSPKDLKFKEKFSTTDPPFLHNKNGKKVLVKPTNSGYGGKHHELKYWTSPRFMIW